MARTHRNTIQKGLNNADTHDVMVSHLDSNIQDCEVKWDLGSVTVNKVSGDDRIPTKLFQILKDDAVKVLHPICQQIWKTQQWPQNWKMSVFIPIPKKGSAKEGSDYHMVVLISHASRGIPGGSAVKNLPAMRETQETRVWSLVRKMSWRRAWQPTPVFLPWESHGQRSLVGYNP